MTETFAIAAPRVFDGTLWHERAAVIVDGDLVAGVTPQTDLHPGLRIERLAKGLLAPGFVDLQINGGGGVLFNDAPGIDAIKAISAAHLKRGTTSMLVTLISDTGDKIDAAIAAAVEAQEARVPGLLGLHLEGPHLGPTRPGAHDPSRIRPMGDADLRRLLAAKARFDVLMVTAV
ncbi:MAG: N-acetylglucosamine-6-phosphate deacetylase, partial [Cucumibacter sp.]